MNVTSRKRASSSTPMQGLPEGIDPVRFELIKNALFFVVNEMALTLVRASYSGILRDNMDFSTGIADLSGEMVTQGLSLPLQFGPMPDAIAAVKARWADRMEPGDVFVLNDPFEGGTHLPDVFFIKPVFVEDEPFCFVCVAGHQVDVGGRIAGSNACDSTEIFAEGLRMPPLKLYERGRPNETLFAIIEKNVRVPKKLFGDFRAQIAALGTGEAGIRELVGKYGKAEVHRYCAELLNYAERATRQAIAKLPEGTWTYTDNLDADGVNVRPVPIKATITIRGDEIVVDTTGSSPQVQGAINSTFSMTKSTAYFAIRSVLQAEIPNNGGFFRPITVIAEKGSILDSVPPAASGARGVTLFRLADAVFGALAQALPDRVPAATEGGATVYSFGAYDERRNPFVLVEIFGGSWGARPDRDGIDGIAHPLLNQRNIPAEIMEVEHPLRILRYGFVADSGGAGRFRGGLSLHRDIQYTGTTPCQLQIRSDRAVTPPYGLGGGLPGATSRNVLNPGTAREKKLKAMETCVIAPDDVVRFVLPGGGGWGPPGERDPEAVAEDVRDGKITAEAARAAYGVALSPDGAVDRAATETLRARERRPR